MLRYLTHKLKTQSLNEADSYPSKNDDDHDSGTESDDEGADAEELEKYMDDSLHCDGSSAPSDRASSTLDTITDTTTEGGGGAGCSPNLLDSALPSDSDHTFDHHSSEEELEVINSGTIAKYPEKRKWSQANTRLSLGSGSSDEEVRDLMCVSAPVEFRSSPPANVPKPSRSLSPPPKLFHASTTIPPHELCSVSPRKRHRRTLLTTTATATSTNLVEHRPSLDFEKMQQNRRKRSSQAYVTRGKSYILYENI
ncbi:uncharacterized protein LOC129971488 isoform X1 [Argiope bruennichi]|uniref:Uncharacterized protein n=1 Tax=Argiope bruennichi TaxID=94029 RepID=A0A8T0FD08_ARGBR|nr:uncharacterized protein LOC129971488 isoform X1 [Argiope bruennichi]KAF8786813.1 hypothetical protein HNY73_008485 [Argiope bruennichi]